MDTSRLVGGGGLQAETSEQCADAILFRTNFKTRAMAMLATVPMQGTATRL